MIKFHRHFKIIGKVQYKITRHVRMLQHKLLLGSDDVQPDLVLHRCFKGREHQRTRHQVHEIKQHVYSQEASEPRLPEEPRRREKRLERWMLLFVQYLPLHNHLLRIREQLAVHCKVIVTPARAHAPVRLNPRILLLLHCDLKSQFGNLNTEFYNARNEHVNFFF